MYLREKYVQYLVPHHGNTNGCSCQCRWEKFCREPVKTTAMRYWASRGSVYTNAQSHDFRLCRKSVLSLCGNKGTACHFGDSPYRAGYMFSFQTLIILSIKTCLYKYLHHSLHKKSISVKEMIKFFIGLCMRNFIPDGTFRHIQSLEFIGS